MEIIKQFNTKVTGRMSDGSDRQETIEYNVVVKDGTNTYFKVFDHDPEESELNILDMELIPKSELEETQENILILENLLFIALQQIDSLVGGGS